MPTQRQYLTIATLAECLVGLALIVAPDAVARLLLGVVPAEAGSMLGRIAGVALLALGIACWGARVDSGSAARASTLWAITVYNAGAGLLLIAFAATGMAHGVAAWIVGLLHLVLAAAFAASLWRSMPASGVQSQHTDTGMP